MQRQSKILGAGGIRKFWQLLKGGPQAVKEAIAIKSSLSREAFKVLLDNGFTFFDTAEAYGIWKCEALIGDMSVATGIDPMISTKFAPWPWRFNADHVRQALQIHWAGFPLINNYATNTFVQGLGMMKLAGLTDAVGVSNFSAERTREAHKVLKEMGVPLASNQVQYSLLYREPERNGVIQACKDTNTAVLAYSPLTQGLLSGNYTESKRPSGARRIFFSIDRIRKIQPLLKVLKEIGQAHDKSQAQVAVNWVISKGEQNGFTAIPILGVKNALQAEEAMGVLGWRLTIKEVKALDAVTEDLGNVSYRAPFEQW